MSDQYWSYTQLLCLFSGTNLQKRVQEETNKVFGVLGDVSLRTAVSKFGGSSAYFDGVGDCIQFGPASEFTVAANSWTVEGWIKAEAVGCVIINGSQSTFPAGFYLTVDAGLSSLTVAIYNSGGGLVGTAQSPTVNLVPDFVHFAVVRNGTTVTVYLNGVGGSPLSVGTAILTASTYMTVGQLNLANYFRGYLDSLRFTNGIARYTANFTPPTAAFELGPNAYDNDYDKVVLHCHFAGETGGGTFVDQKAHTIENIGSASLTTADSRFGGSAYQGGVVYGRYLKVSHADMNMGAGDFTVEMWFKPVLGNSDPRSMFSFLAADGVTLALAWDRWGSGGQASNTYIMGTSVPLVPNTSTAWYHIAFVRDAGTIRVYLNGGQVGSTTVNVATLNFNGVFHFGGRPGAYSDNGTIDEIRVTKGLCRYKNGSPFSAPTAPFPDFAIQKLSGTVRDPSGTPIARTVRSYRKSDGLLIDSSVSDPTTGAFTLRATDVSEHFVIVHDDVKNALIYDHIIPVV